LDTDGDFKPDSCETTDFGALTAPMSTATNLLLRDSDLDGLLDGEEDPGTCLDILTITKAMTNPRLFDTDGDGWGDGLEVMFPAVFPNGPLVADLGPYTDADGDGVPDIIDPDDTKIDTDGDGFTDYIEIVYGTDPTNPLSFPSIGDVTGDGNVNLAD